MRPGKLLIIGVLAAAASCEDKVARDADRAADRVQTEAERLRRAQHRLSIEMQARAGAGSRAREAQHGAPIPDVSRETVAYAQAQQDFEYLKLQRVQSLKLEHSVIASQPLVILAIAEARSMHPSQRMWLDENLVIFRERLAETRALIERLADATADEWERRDDEVARAMAGLFLARDASWQALEGKPADEGFPRT